MKYAVELYTQARVEVWVEADTPEQAARYARVDATTLDFEPTDPHEIVADWDAETGDWEVMSVNETDGQDGFDRYGDPEALYGF